MVQTNFKVEKGGKVFSLLFLFLFISLFFSSCADDDSIASAEDTTDPSNFWANFEPFTTTYGTFQMPMSEHFNPVPEMKGVVAISEASGLAYSVNNPGMLWSHNDSGNTNTIFLIDAETAEIVARYKISGTNNIDWEDIEITLDPTSGEAYLYIADTGDNDEKRLKYAVYRFKEPVYKAGHNNETWEPEDFSKIEINYPDKSHDTESIMVDPETLDIYFITKRDNPSIIYVAPYPQKEEGINQLYKVGTFSFTQASAATFSLDGKKMLIKNRQEIFYWEREVEETTIEMLQREPLKAPYVGEIQGEAICFDPDYNYYTLSEAPNQPSDAKLYKYFYTN